jgi:hypothetical protein
MLASTVVAVAKVAFTSCTAEPSISTRSGNAGTAARVRSVIDAATTRRPGEKPCQTTAPARRPGSEPLPAARLTSSTGAATTNE